MCTFKTSASMSKSYQSSAIQILSIDRKVRNLASELREKVKVTLQPIAPSDIPNQWGEEVLACSSKATSSMKTCWLKTITGAWCTSVRLHTYVDRCCIAGCTDSADELCHYVACLILWQLARDTFRIQESCASSPSSSSSFGPGTAEILFQPFCGTGKPSSSSSSSSSSMILPKLSVVQPSLPKVELLAFAHALYHQCVNDTLCIGDDGMARSAQ